VALAEDEPAKSPGVLERIGNTAKKVGNKIEQGFTKAGTKLKEKKVGEKIEQKLKKAANKTAEGFKKAGDKIDQKLNH
jgi:F0F1-type ATP synthase membrane subunit b/b'